MASVNSGSAHGSAANPYVISTKEQWVFFANVITNQTAGYTGTAKVWVLGADINLGGNTINAVGRHSTGFQGTLYGNKHSISNGTVAYQSWIDGTSHFAVGLFHKINGGKVYDLTIDSSIKFTMKTNINGSGYIYMGSLAAVANSATVVNVSSSVSISLSQTGTAKVTMANIGGMCGSFNSSKIYKSSWNGTIYYRSSGSQITANMNTGPMVAGFFGYASTVVIDQCYVSGTVSAEHNGARLGGLIGQPSCSGNGTFTVSNVVINVAVKMLGTNVYVSDLGIFMGEDPHQQMQENPSSTYNYKFSKIYIVGNSKVYQGTADKTGIYAIYGTENNGTVADRQKTTSGVYLPIASSIPVYPTNQQTAAVDTKSGSTANVVTEANKNSAITNNFSVSSSGTVTSKLSTFLSTQWADTLPASRVLFTATSTLSLTALSLTNLGYVIPIITQLVCFIISMAVRFTIYLLKVLLN